MKKSYLLILLFCLANGFAQTKLKKADKLFYNYYYIEAAKGYEEYLATNDKPAIQTIKNVADAYYFTKDYRNALKWYQRLYDIQADTMSEEYFLRYTQCLKGVADYEKANQMTKDYLMKKGDQAQIDHYISQSRQMDSLAKAKPLYTVKNIDVNSKKSDFGAVFYGEKIVFSSSRDTTKFNEKLYSWNEQPFLDMYIADRNVVDGSLFNVMPFLPEALTKYHEATITFSPDLKTAYYTTNILKKKKLVLDGDKTNNFQIIKATLQDGKVISSEKVFFDSKDYSVGHPALSPDGKWLFFASDMPGGYGKTDLYVVEITSTGTMGIVQNLGPKINTIGNEEFPFFSNGVLYFSSDGHYGWGDLDIYSSKFSEGLNFSEPKNLGQPINSNKDDFCYIVDPTDAFGYISSNRDLGAGDDDIYYFTKAKPECNQLISGKAIDSKSKLPIDNAKIRVYNAFDDLITETVTDAEGKYKVTIPCSKKVKIVASKDNYSQAERSLETGNVNEAEIKDIDFELSKYEDLIVVEKGQEKIIINPIFFEYDKWDITPEAAIELDKVVFVMKGFPNVKIKIESHTDSRGKDAYNLILSDKRAKSTQMYILSKGIDPIRIESAIGYGESRLTNKCSNGVKCTEEQHLKNRRSDFIVIQK